MDMKPILNQLLTPDVMIPVSRRIVRQTSSIKYIAVLHLNRVSVFILNTRKKQIRDKANQTICLLK
jgi:hypothetical protein